MQPAYEDMGETARFLSQRGVLGPKVGVILGSGLGEWDQRLESPLVVPYEEIPNFPRSRAPGHRGNLLFGGMAGVPTVLLQGRFHYYEGYSTWEITFPVRVLASLGIEILIVTNAAGGLHPLFRPGDLMLIADHIHLIPENPLRGLLDERLGNPFPDMSQAYDPDLIRMAEEAALELRIPLRKGTYVSIPGPSLETPAETRLLRAAGADAVGMSTTPEVIVARSVGLRVLGLSVISNVNRPDCMEPILVDEILRASKEATPRLTILLEAIMSSLASTGE